MALPPALASLAARGLYDPSPAKRSRKRDITNPLLSDEEQSSLLRDLGGGAVGGLSMFGAALDLPGSIVRDVISLGGNNPQNPFDQLLTPLQHENRITGRELMRSYGMVGPKDTWGNFSTGLAAEIALDPLTYLTLGGTGLLTSTGKAAKASGTLAKGIGNQIRAGQRGLFGVGMPFTKSPTPLLAGNAGAARVGDAMSAFGDAVRFGNIPGTDISPGRMFTAVLNSKARGVEGEAVQRLALGPLAEATDQSRALAEKHLGEIGSKLEGSALDWTNPSTAIRARGVLEHYPYTNPQNPFRQMSPDWVQSHADILADRPTMEAIEHMRPEQSSLMHDLQALGADKHFLTDEMIEYATRHTPRMTRDTVGRGYSNVRDFGAKRAEDLSRKDFMTNVEGGSETLAHASADPRILRTIKMAVKNGWQPEDVAKQIAIRHPEFNARTYVRRVPVPGGQPGQTMLVSTRAPVPVSANNPYMKKLTEFSEWLMNQPEPLREAGIFPNNPFFDAGAGIKNMRDAKAVMTETLKFLGKMDFASGKSDAGIRFITTPTSDTIAIGEMLDSLAMGRKGANQERIALDHIRTHLSDSLQRTGQNLTPAQRVAYANQIASLNGATRIDRKIATDLTKYAQNFRNPQAVGKLVTALDTYTNMFKLGVTGLWPAYHVRNLLSSQFQNMVAGNFSGRSVGDAYKMLGGGNITDAAQIPVLRRLLQLEGRPQTSAEATKLIRELSQAGEVVARHEGMAADLAGATAPVRPATLQDFTAGLPGQNPLTPGTIASEFTAQAPGTTWNPLEATARGLFGRTESTHAGVKAAESIGGLVEGLARLSPLIHKLRRMPATIAGNPATRDQIIRMVREAADEIGASQVQYGFRHFAPIERELFKRVIPFYSFTSRMMPWMLRELAERPGGRLAQTIRGSVAAQDPGQIMPDYVAETAAIPVAGGPLEAVLGTPTDGGQRFVTGFGLAHEDPLSFFGKGLGGAGLEVLSRLNPAAKAPLQVATGQSFFQQGPVGGRPLEDLDPTIGRTLANIMGRENAVRYPFDRQAEALLETLPISRLATTARTLTDRRKGAVAKAVATTTGVRLADVSPHTQDSLYRERMKAFEKRNLGGRTFETSYVPDYVKEGMSDEQLQFVERLELMKRELVRRQQVRKLEDIRQKSAVVRIP